MSHPNPSHDRDNEYPHDEYSAGPSKKKHSFADTMKQLRKPLQKAIGYKRRERHSKAKNMALHKAKHKVNKYDVGNNPKGRDEYDDRQD